MIGFELAYNGSLADDHEIDLYDVSQAMVGFQRSLAITTHFVINGTIITQAPSLKGAIIIARAPEAGSFKIPTFVQIVGAAWLAGQIPSDTPVGHMIYSAYDYVINSTLGFHVDFDRSLGQQLEELRERDVKGIPHIDEKRMNSVIEKVEPAVKEMHRPIVKSRTASNAVLSFKNAEDIDIATFDRRTYDYLMTNERDDTPLNLTGKVSSYNMNTYKGRIYIDDERRPVPFELDPIARVPDVVARVTSSLRENARNPSGSEGVISVKVFPRRKRTGKLMSYIVVDAD